jgi:ribosomal protein L40E/osmotically-inducible protein OsmY
MICEKCKANIPDVVKFCPKCGAKIEIAKAQEIQTKKCPSCGAENPASAKFCKVDGYNFQQAGEKPEERPMETEKPPNVLLCPKCGTPHPLTSKYCRKDGASLQKASTPEQIKSPEVIEKEIRPEEIAEPKVEAPREVKEEKIKPEIEKIKDVILCPKCGASNPLTAKFCRKDGTPLKEEIKPAVVQPKVREAVLTKRGIKEVGIRRTSRVWIWLIVSGLVLITAGAGSYLYFSGRILKRQGEVTTIPEVRPPEHTKATEEIEKPISPQQKPQAEIVSPPKPEKVPPETVVDIARIEEELNEKFRKRGLNNIYAQVNKDLVAILSGTAKSNSDKTLAINIAKSYRELRGVTDKIRVELLDPTAKEEAKPAEATPVEPPSHPPVDITKLQEEINIALKRRGLSNVYAEVDRDLVATLKGFVKDKAEESDGINIAKSYKELRDVRNNLQVKASTKLPKELEAEINNALRGAGFRGVKAYVNDNFEVTLKGIVLSKNNKDLAFRIARSFKEVKEVYDNIFVGPFSSK